MYIQYTTSENITKDGKILLSAHVLYIVKCAYPPIPLAPSNTKDIFRVQGFYMIKDYYPRQVTLAYTPCNVAV